jgi:hypothetical protein
MRERAARVAGDGYLFIAGLKWVGKSEGGGHGFLRRQT